MKKRTVVLIATLMLAGLVGCASETKSSSSGKIAGKKASTFPDTVKNPKPGEIIVKCAGIAKKGKNHCGANGHTCGGLAKTDFDPNEWIYVREDICNATPGRIVGRKLVTEG